MLTQIEKREAWSSITRNWTRGLKGADRAAVVVPLTPGIYPGLYLTHNDSAADIFAPTVLFFSTSRRTHLLRRRFGPGVPLLTLREAMAAEAAAAVHAAETLRVAINRGEPEAEARDAERAAETETRARELAAESLLALLRTENTRAILTDAGGIDRTEAMETYAVRLTRDGIAALRDPAKLALVRRLLPLLSDAACMAEVSAICARRAAAVFAGQTDPNPQPAQPEPDLW